MNKTTNIIAIVLIFASMLFAGAELLNFNARSNGSSIVVTWQTSSESNVKEFVVERKTVNGNYVDVGIVYPRSDRNYVFVDQTAFKTSDQLYIYVLKIVDNDGSVSYSSPTAVSHNVSSVKRTWGSIKALFR